MTTIVRIFFFTITCLVPCVAAKAQQFGGNPPSTRWRQINSDTARIIFPKGLDSAAQIVAKYVRHLAQQNAMSLGNKLGKIEIVLQNQSILTNGYVGQGPFRSEFYMMPSADNYSPSSLSWPAQLTVHEYRHVQQYNNFNNGASAIMKKLFGQEGYALAVNAAVPNWFFEGDAVLSETIWTPHGRGSLPFFLKAFPALWQSGKKYSWMKLRNGSLKNYVPNHYDLGYLLVRYGTQKFGCNFWQKVTKDASAYKGLFYPMQQAIKRHTGWQYRTFRDSALDSYKRQYEYGLQTPTPLANTHTIIPVNERTLTDYYYPYQISDQNLLYLKSSNKRRPAFYVKTTSGEQFIRHRDISIEEQYGYNNGKIVYAAYQSHPRWRWQSYSILKILDIASGKQKTIGHKTRYFSPDISPNGKWIIANKVAMDGHSSLVLINADNGDTMKEIQNKQVAYFSNPKIMDDSTVIAILRNTDATTHIAQINIYSGNIKQLTPPSNTIIGTLHPHNGKIYFSAAKNLKDELFYFDIVQQKLFKMQTEGVGSYFVNAGFGKITWSRFTANGYQLQQVDASSAVWEPYPMQQFIQPPSNVITDNTTFKENISNTSPAEILETQPYPQLSHPFNFHSWRPNYSAPEFSLSIYGNNILNTTETQLYYLYNETDKTQTAGGAMVYGGWFPHLQVGSEYTFDRKAIISKNLKEWNEWNSYASISVPLSWASGKTYKSFYITSNYHFRYDFNKGQNASKFQETKLSYLAHGIGWAQQIQAAAQDIYPKFGYSADAQFRHTIPLPNSWQGYGSLNIYLPGIAATHSWVLNGAAQYLGSSQPLFSNKIAYARGFSATNAAGVFTTRINYHLPLLYPDWGFGNVCYLKRIRANMFYDGTWLFNKNIANTNHFKSSGVEVFLDAQWWNQLPLTLGFRAGSRITPVNNTSNLFFEIVLPTYFIPK